MIQAFARLSDRLLAHLGEEAFLRGEVPVRVNLQFDTEKTGEYDDMTVEREIATLPIAANPSVGDTLVFGTLTDGVLAPTRTLVLDAYLSSNGFTSQYVVREV